MQFPDHVLTVSATVEPGREAEFNHWYNTEHTPDAVRTFPGCLGAARYQVILGDGSHQYMAMYAFPSAARIVFMFRSFLRTRRTTPFGSCARTTNWS